MENQFHLRDKDEYIKLGQLLKAVGWVSSGVEAKDLILAGEILVNGDVEQRRGRKLYPGDHVVFDAEEVTIQR